ncbi:DUF3180 domain-containing protein [Herbiconiux sp. L3-i23]|uniref:DUF3180 domain-containing protein n=1 Tax=Herbiconiux sp. L3-i23 TaxID=2905871 RepID=UPI00206500CA|nr:DUF3180 domain-containing protein [Herbiconiux sp. L3-i23]BDI23969.1 hypothetical protein L3i23_27450 [Herbiconiux sp. L3-i23]
MKPTTPGLPVALAGAGGVLAYLLEVGLVAAGRPSFVPPFTFPISLVVIAGLVLLFGWPIRQVLRGKSRTRLDPFRAMRVVLFAKASVLVGALLGGAAVGVAAHLIGRPVLAQSDDLVRAVLSVVASAVAVVAGLVVEHWCTLPPDDEDDSRVGVQGQ